MPIFSSKKHSQPPAGTPSAHSQQSIPPELNDPSTLSHPRPQQSPSPQQSPQYYQPPSDERYQLIGGSGTGSTSTHSIDRPTTDLPPVVPAKDAPQNYIANHHRYSYAAPQSKGSSHPPESKKDRLLGRLGFGQKESQDPANPSSKSISRTVSLREKRSAASNRYSIQPDESGRQFWDGRQHSVQHLPISSEVEEEHGYDPYLVRGASPVVPSQDHSSDQQYSQQGQAGFLPTPQLQRSNTDQSSQSGAGPDRFGQPDPALNPQGGPPGYQPYQSPPQGNPQQPGAYQAFHPQGPPPSVSDPNVRLQYYQQQGDQQYQAARPTNQQQDGQFLQPARPASQQSHPQGDVSPSVRLIQQPPSLNQGDQDLLNIGRPPSQQQLSPPSPLVQNYTPYLPQGDQGPPPERTSLDINQQAPQPGPQPLSGPPQQGAPMAPLSSGGKLQRAAEVPKGALQHARDIGLQAQQPPPFNQGQMQPPTPGYPPQQGAPPQQGQQYRPGQPQLQENDPSRNNTPPPRSAPAAGDDEDGQFNQLVREHKELRDKYQKVKKYYFEKEAQVHSLQNTLARQRLSNSRTSLDDSEYATRFSRLDGLISQLAFNIRKNWREIPAFLTTSVNKDAVVTGKQEMTAVGRAFIAAWLCHEVFEQYFHPDIEETLSAQLKLIQTNVRRYVGQVQSAEEEENLSSKIISWRLTTLEGLVEQLRSPDAAAHRAKFVDTLNERLIADFQRHLQEPCPPELNGGVYMIVELAVNILLHLPCESRDVCIDYYLPGTPVASETMKTESGIPALTNPLGPADAADKDDRASFHSAASDAKEEATGEGPPGGAQGQSPPSKDEKSGRRSMLAGLMSGSSKKAAPAPVPVEKGKAGSQVSLPGDGKEEKRVRMAVGLGVQVRGRSVLFKAPVYPF